MSKKKRVLIIADGHSGHVVGLTPPGFDPDEPPRKHPECWTVRRGVWKWFSETVAALSPIDVLIYNGDAVDGKGPKSGGTEQIYIDRNDQVEMAVATINHVGARQVFMSYGTAYHTGKLEDWEDAVAREANNVVKIGGEDNIEINGMIFNYRHHCSRSTIPHGRYTAIAREKLWNDLWAERGEYPKADVLIRSHVHYHGYVGGINWVAMTTPALQAYGGKYGTRRATGTVDIGMVSFDVYPDRKGMVWKCHYLRLPMHQPISL